MIRHLGGVEVFATSPAEDYDVIRADYKSRLFDAFIGYLSSGGSVARWLHAASRAISEDFSAAFYRGYQDGGGALPVEADDDAWLTTRVPHEWHYLSELFKVLNDWRLSEQYTEAANFECKGYQCQHFWKDPKTGERWTF